MSRSDDHHINGTPVKPKDGGAVATGFCSNRTPAMLVLCLVCLLGCGGSDRRYMSRAAAPAAMSSAKPTVKESGKDWRLIVRTSTKGSDESALWAWDPADRSAPMLLARDRGIGELVWSSSRKQLVYVKAVDHGSSDLCISDPFVAKRTERRRIDGGVAGLLSASSRRPEIAYQVTRYDQQGRPVHEESIHVMDLSSGATREIRWPGHAITSAVYSPADDRLAVSGLPGGGLAGVDDELAVVVADPGDSRRPFQDTGVKGFPWAWSPDGSRIAGYSISREGAEREWALPLLFVFDLGTGTRKDSLAPKGSADEMGAWSADSQRFVFSSNRKGTMQLHMFDASTGSVAPLHASEEGDHFPEWSPDGRVIVFMRLTHGKRELYPRDSDGINPRPALHQPESDFRVTSCWIEVPQYNTR